MLLEKDRPRKSELGRGLLALVLALVGHGVFAVFLLVLSLVHFGESPHRAKNQPVTLRTLSGEQWTKNRGADQHLPASAQASKATPPPEKKKEEKRKPEEKPKGQVVAVAPGNNQEDPNAKYLAESSNKTARETRAKQTTPAYRNAMPQRTSDHAQEAQGQDAAEKASVAGNNGMGSDDRPLREGGGGKPVFELPDVKEQQKIAMRESTPGGAGPTVSNHEESEAVQGNGQRFKIQQGSQGAEEETSMGKTGNPGAANLLPSASVMDKIVGAAANDHLQDVDEGEGTYLNTKEWKYAAFFNRVKQSVGLTWNPGDQLRMRDPTFQIYGGRDRYTVVNVTLTERGQLKEIFVEKSCGLDFLDLEAVHAFERAQPFPNPPPGLLEHDDKVHFQFGFYLEMSGSPRVRLFRNPN